jgi:uncharacterized membrane protein YesL
MWAFPNEDENVWKLFYNEYKTNFEQPKKIDRFYVNSFANDKFYKAVLCARQVMEQIGLRKIEMP